MSERAEQLVSAAREAGRVRAYETDPDVVALRVERVRAWSGRLAWTGILLGLGFTMANVQRFAAQGAPPGSGQWVTAWLLDPMVSLILISVLLAEQVTSRYQIPIGVWPRVAKWAALASTYGMNTWSAWAAADAALIVLHSVPPLMVFVAVEATPAVRDRLTEAMFAAETLARDRVESSRPVGVEAQSRPADARESRPADTRESTPGDSDRPSPVGAVESAPTPPAEQGQSAPGESRESRSAEAGSAPGSRPDSGPDGRGLSTPLGRSESAPTGGCPVEASRPPRPTPASRPRLVRPVDLDELQHRLADAVEAGEVDPRTGRPVDPHSAESIRRTLGVGSAAARSLRHVNGHHREES